MKQTKRRKDFFNGRMKKNVCDSNTDHQSEVMENINGDWNPSCDVVLSRLTDYDSLVYVWPAS